jgi:hypothetical protein
MGMTIDEYRAKLGSKPNGLSHHDRLLELRAMRQAEPVAGALTGDPHWDLFVSYIQAALEETGRQIDEWIKVLRDPAVVSHDELMRAKVCLAECTGRVDAWSSVLRLPHDIKAQGEQAAEILARLGDADAD